MGMALMLDDLRTAPSVPKELAVGFVPQYSVMPPPGFLSCNLLNLPNSLCCWIDFGFLLSSRSACNSFLLFRDCLAVELKGKYSLQAQKETLLPSPSVP